MRLAECVVAREKDLGVNDHQHTVITNLGHILKEGDMVFGYDCNKCFSMVPPSSLAVVTHSILSSSHYDRYDLVSASWAHEEESSRLLNRKELPDVVLVRKV